MRAAYIFALLILSFALNAASVQLDNWSYTNGKNGGSCSFEEEKLIIRAGKTKWNIRNFQALPAVPGRGVKLAFNLEVLAPRGAMMLVNLYDAKSGKLFHTMKIADTAGFMRKYEKIINIPEDVRSFYLELSGFPGTSFAISSITSADVPALAEAAPAKRVRRKSEAPAGERHSEKLDRGVVAFENGKGAYISWRLLKSDPADITFDIYRDGRKINPAPLSQTTDYSDPVRGKQYTVKPASCNAVSGSAVTGKITRDSISYCRIFRLSDKDARVDKVGIGDLDGDGVYDYVVRHMPSHVDPWYTAYFAPEGTCKLEAVNGRTGKVMWKKDLGWGIETGVWYSPFTVFDLNGDGKAEVALKTAEGDPRDADGKVTSGKEYLSILDGMTGREIFRTSWPSRDGFLNLDIAYNFYSRNQMAVAYLDGKTPHLIVMRGTYSLMLVEAWKFDGKKLHNVWKYSSAGRAEEFQGQGAHTTRCCDIDGDGKDEIVLGNMALDDDGEPLWSNARRHPDFLYVADLIPQRPGLEVATCLEITRKKGGITFSCARTGKCIWELQDPIYHVHYGFCGDIDPLYRGVLVGGTDTGAGNRKYPPCSWIFTGDGKMLARGKNIQFAGESPIFVYWDGDLRREYHKDLMKKYNGGNVGGGTEGVLLTVADVYGDWREEIITSGAGELRIYSSSIPAFDRRPSLMQDHFYRMAIATASCGYHYDAMPEILPSTGNTDIVLTLKKPDLLQIAVTAPMQKKISGKVTLQLPENMTSSFRSEDIVLEKGGIWHKNIKLTGSGVGKYGKIYASLELPCGRKLTTETLSGRPPMPEIKVKLPGYWIDAENIKSQFGGKVSVRSWRGVHRKCFTAWSKPGHKINWELKVSKAGKYRIIFRYATKRNNVWRKLEVNGKDYGKVRFLPTGAMGKSVLDWKSYSPDILLDLTPGVQKISMECITGALSLDAISFERVAVRDRRE